MKNFVDKQELRIQIGMIEDENPQVGLYSDMGRKVSVETNESDE